MSVLSSAVSSGAAAAPAKCARRKPTGCVPATAAQKSGMGRGCAPGSPAAECARRLLRALPLAEAARQLHAATGDGELADVLLGDGGVGPGALEDVVDVLPRTEHRTEGAGEIALDQSAMRVVRGVDDECRRGRGGEDQRRRGVDEAGRREVLRGSDAAQQLGVEGGVRGLDLAVEAVEPARQRRQVDDDGAQHEDRDEHVDDGLEGHDPPPPRARRPTSWPRRSSLTFSPVTVTDS
jgi:hypothetical protein